MAETDYKTTIKIDGDAKGATAAIERLRRLLDSGLIGTLGKIRAAMAAVSRALGVFWLAWNGIQLVISGFQKLRDMITASARAAERLALDNSLDRATRAAERLLGRQREINKELEKQAKLAAASRDVEEISQSAQRDLADSRREVDRAMQLAGVSDPRQRRVMQERFADEDAQRKAADEDERNGRRMSQLWAEHAQQKALAEAAKERVNDIEREINLQVRELQNIQSIKTKDDESAAAKEKSIEGRKRNIAALERERDLSLEAASAAMSAAETAKKTADAIANAMAEQRVAAFNRQQGAAVTRNAAWGRTDEEDRRSVQSFNERLAREKANAERDIQYDAMDDAGKIKELRRREGEALERLEAAERILAAELYKDVRQRDEGRMSRAKADAEAAQQEALRAREQQEAILRRVAEKDAAQKADFETFAQQLADNEMQAAQDRHYATLDDSGKLKELDRRETEARQSMAEAQEELADEMSKDVAQRSEERISRLKATIEEQQGRALSAIAEREGLERDIEDRDAAERNSRADDLAASFMSRGNRLTAMGLGDGSDSAKIIDDISGKVSTVIDVLKQMINEIANPKAEPAQGAARFGA